MALEALKAHLCGHVHRGGQQDLGETEPEQEGTVRLFDGFDVEFGFNFSSCVNLVMVLV